MLNKRELLEDVSAYILLQYEELLSPLVKYFDEPVSNPFLISKPKPDYNEFISDLIYLSKTSIDFEAKLPKSINSLEDVLTPNEIEIYLQHLNKNFEHGYPDYDKNDNLPIGGSFSIDLNEIDLKSYFKDYNKLRCHNNSVYISYLYLILISPDNGGFKLLKSEIEKFNVKFHTYTLLPLDLSSGFKDLLINQYKARYFDLINEDPFQLQGFYDNKGSFVDIDLTLKYWLQLLDVHKISYKANQQLIKEGIDFILLQYIHFKFNNKNFNITESRSLNDINSKYYSFLEEHEGLEKFLKDKEFGDEEIQAIINTLTDNCFSELSFRWIKLNQVDFFRFCYLFYIFDFFNECRDNDFKNENDFNCLNFEGKNPKSNNQLKKYYYNIDDRNKKHYPFNTVEQLIDKIDNKLQIDKGKLKSIPKSNFY